MMSRQIRHAWVLLLIACAFIAGCGDGGSSSGHGALTLRVTDSPVDMANRVVVVFGGVQLKPEAGNSVMVDLPEDRAIDLLSLEGGESEVILNSISVDPGRYNWIRLLVKAERGVLDSFIELQDLTLRSLHVPSGDETGLKLNRSFVVPVGGEADFTVDFDLRKSVHNPEGYDDYILRPTLRIVDNAEVGAIEGTVAMALLNPEGGNAVYVYEGNVSEPDDIGGVPEPLCTATVDEDAGRYKAAYLPPGVYKLAFTSEASADDPSMDDDISFSGPQAVTVVQSQSVVVDIYP